MGCTQSKYLIHTYNDTKLRQTETEEECSICSVFPKTFSNETSLSIHPMTCKSKSQLYTKSTESKLHFSKRSRTMGERLQEWFSNRGNTKKCTTKPQCTERKTSILRSWSHGCGEEFGVNEVSEAYFTRQMSRSIDHSSRYSNFINRPHHTAPVSKKADSNRSNLSSIFGQEAIEKISIDYEKRRSSMNPSLFTAEHPIRDLLPETAEEIHTVLRGKDERGEPTMAIVNYGSSARQGNSEEDEDRHIINIRKTDKDDHIVDLGIFGIFDGHNGADVSEYVSKHLPTKIIEEIDRGCSLKNSILDSITMVDHEIYEQKMNGGSTAIVSLLQGDHLTVFSIGDSCAILSSNDGKEITKLCLSHKPNLPSECARIEKAKGRIINNRVLGILGVTRAFGDNEFKTSKNEYKKKFNGDLISSEPDIIHRRVTEEDDFVVLCSDGILEVMSMQEIIKFIHRKLETCTDVNVISEELVQSAITLGSEDNLTVIIIVFMKSQEAER